MQRHRKSTKILVFILTISLILCSCSSPRVLKSEYSSDTDESRDFIIKNLQAGNRVRILTKDDRKIEFKVREISSEAIIGNNQRILLCEIARLEKMQFDWETTLARTFGTWQIVSAVAGVLTFIILIQLFDDLRLE